MYQRRSVYAVVAQCQLRRSTCDHRFLLLRFHVYFFIVLMFCSHYFLLILTTFVRSFLWSFDGELYPLFKE